jgi:uncharacterized membrane protein YkoI
MPPITFPSSAPCIHVGAATSANYTMKHTILKTALVAFCAAALSHSPTRAEEEGKEIAKAQVPAAALAAIQKYAGEGKVGKVLLEQHGKTTVYEATIKGPGKAQREVAVTEDGKIQCEEIVVTLADVPEKAREAMTAHAKGGKITEVIQIRENGRTLYEAEIETDGK